MDELISNELQWTPPHGQAKVRRSARTYIQQVCADKGCSLEDLPGTMEGRDGWRQRVRYNCAERDMMMMMMMIRVNLNCIFRIKNIFHRWFPKCKLFMGWKWFIQKISLASYKCLFWGYSKCWQIKQSAPCTSVYKNHYTDSLLGHGWIPSILISLITIQL